MDFRPPHVLRGGEGKGKGGGSEEKGEGKGRGREEEGKGGRGLSSSVAVRILKITVPYVLNHQRTYLKDAILIDLMSCPSI